MEAKILIFNDREIVFQQINYEGTIYDISDTNTTNDNNKFTLKSHEGLIFTITLNEEYKILDLKLNN